MPTYVYECIDCAQTEEVVCKMSEMETTKPNECRHCNGEVKRVICNKNRHTDDTPWRKGHYNSKEDWR